jgi:hypothetical protein
MVDSFVHYDVYVRNYHKGETMSKQTVRVKLEGVDIELAISVGKDAHGKLLEIINLTFPGAKEKTRLAPEVVKETSLEDYRFTTKAIEGKTISELPRAKIEKAFRDKPQVFTEEDKAFLTQLIKGQ